MITKSEHELQEEQQWMRLFKLGNSEISMLMMFVQKLCAVFHVFDPANDLGILVEEKWENLKPLLVNRIFHVIDWAESVGLGDLDGIKELRNISAKFEQLPMSGLKAITEEIHLANHRINDQLESEFCK